MVMEKSEIRDLAESYVERGDPTGWFEQVYQDADGKNEQVVWADLVPNPCLVDWLRQNCSDGKRAIVVGCGLGDDVAYLAENGLEVIGFDVSETAIQMSQKRFPEISKLFRVADLFNPPTDWQPGFDLVFECNTIQALSGEWRVKALNGIADLVAPGGVVLVSCRSRQKGQKENEFPLPLDQAEIAGFERAGLKQLSLKCYDDDQSPPIAHFMACYQRV